MINQPIQANIAVESDYEFYSQFRGAADPVAEATNYIASLIGCECRYNCPVCCSKQSLQQCAGMCTMQAADAAASAS